MKKIFYTTLALVAVALSSCCSSEPATPSPIAQKQKGALRILTYNVGAIGKFVNEEYTKEQNLELIANIVREAEVDVVAWQELDSCNGRNNYFQQEALTKAISEKWHCFYAPAINYRDGKYGIGISGKDKPIDSFYAPLPHTENRENRALAVVEYKDYIIASTHLNGGIISSVEAISATMKEKYGNSTKPVFLGGDMNALRNDETMQLLQQDWTLLSTPDGTTVKGKRCIDHILQLNNKAPKAELTATAVITEALAGDVKLASDHYPVYIDVKF